MNKCGKSFLPECEYFTTGGCISPFNCIYKREGSYITTATSEPYKTLTTPIIQEDSKNNEIPRLIVELPVCVEDEIFIINKKTKSIMSCAVKSIFSTDEKGVEWNFAIEFYCDDCDRFETCDFCSAKCIWGDCQIECLHGDEEDIIGYTGVNLSDYNKTWFTDRDKAIKELQGGEK